MKSELMYEKNFQFIVSKFVSGVHLNSVI